MAEFLDKSQTQYIANLNDNEYTVMVLKEQVITSNVITSVPKSYMQLINSELFQNKRRSNGTGTRFPVIDLFNKKSATFQTKWNVFTLHCKNYLDHRDHDYLKELKVSLQNN